MNRYTVPAINLLFILTFFSCNRIEPKAPEHTQLDSTLTVPVTTVSVPIFYPVKELEAMANEKLASKIFQADLAINDNSDSLFLTISRFKPITLTYDGDRGITYTLPIEITGFVKAKVIGIKINNKTPVHAKVIITVFSDLYVDKQWNLASQSQLKKITWVEEPKLKIAGIKFNLRPSLEKALDKNKDKITQKLDESVKNGLKIRAAIEKLWTDIQKPIRINKKVVRVWLKPDATDMNGRLLRNSKDTLMIEAGIQATLRSVLDSASSMKPVKPLPRFKRKTSEDHGIVAYALATIPFKTLNEVFSQVTDTMKFEFGGREVKIKSSEVYGTPEGLAIHIRLAGDVKADVYLRGTIGFDSLAKNIVIENFGFDINSEQSLVSAANWMVNDEIVARLKPYLFLPLEHSFDMIPTLITKGIEKGKVGRKIEVRFSELKVTIYQYIVTKDNIQIILSAKGRGDVQLQKDLFTKKKKKMPV